ncbi:hypothetical protein ACM6XX_004425 [Vibrio parahaemolyticus]
MKKQLLLLIASTLPCSAMAEWQSYDWNEAYTDAAASTYTSSDGISVEKFTSLAYIYSAYDRKQRIGFLATTKQGEISLDMCNPSDFEKGPRTYSKEDIWNIDGQNVTMAVYCREEKSGSYSIDATPLTSAGERYILNTFRKNNFVWVESSFFTVKYSAKGFKSAWSNFGGDAL